MIGWFILLAIGAYLLGSVPSSYLAVRWARGIDIRTVGTGKIGASNVLSAGPKWLVVPVAIFDIGKGALSVWVAKTVGLNGAAQVTVGLLAIAGHNWPVFLRFQGGGRGVFTSLGVIAMLSWKLGLITLVLTYLFAPIRQVAFGVFVALIALPFLSWFLARPLDIADRLAITCGFIALTVMALGKRLVAHRTELSKQMPWRDVMLNRLLFDRDIGDRRLWVSKAKAGKAQ
jgi:glycerol-3-phosphate acyltransferase PlsY